jgi:hypothetical protein
LILLVILKAILSRIVYFQNKVTKFSEIKKEVTFYEFKKRKNRKDPTFTRQGINQKIG